MKNKFMYRQGRRKSQVKSNNETAFASMVFFILTFIVALLTSCEKVELPKDRISSDLLIVSNEGTFGSSNGSLSVIRDNKVIQTVSDIGDVVQSVVVSGNKLFTAINNSHEIKIFEISSDGLKLPGITISTEGSSPREMVVVDNKLYFTNWNSKDVKVLDLFTYKLLTLIEVNGLPEAIVSDGSKLFVSILMNEDYSDANEVVAIDIESNSIVNTYNVGAGPTSLLLTKNELFVARTYYDSNWNAYYGTSVIELTSDPIVSKVDYGAGVVCGGSVNLFQQTPYRSYEGGIAKLNRDLSLDKNSLIGFNESSNTYAVDTFDNRVVVGTVDGYVNIFLEDGSLESSIKVGIYPGDFAVWSNKNN